MNAWVALVVVALVALLVVRSVRARRAHVRAAELPEGERETLAAVEHGANARQEAALYLHMRRTNR